MRWLIGIINVMDMNLGKFWETVTGKPGVLQSMGSQRVRHDLVNEQQLAGQQSKLTNNQRVM